MGCILACFRLKSDKKKNKAHLKSSPVPSKSKEPLLSKESSVSVFISEGMPCEQVGDLNFGGNIGKDILEKELRDEVKFLKSCGTILETPPELRMESEKLITKKDITSSESSSCVPGRLCKELVCDEQQDDSNFTHDSYADFTFGEHQAHSQNGNSISVDTLRNSVYLDVGPESAVLDASSGKGETHIEPHGTKDSVCFGSIELDPKVESVVESAVSDVSPSQEVTQLQVLSHQGVRLESDENDPGTESEVSSLVLDISPSQDVTQVQPLSSKRSPYPTPLKLTDEMETPGTIYQASTQNLRRKNGRVRTQYVYPVLNPVENLRQPTVPSEAYKQLSRSENDKRSPNREEFDKENHGSVKRLRSLTPTSDTRWKATRSPVTEEVTASSLSQWLHIQLEDDEKKETEASAMKNLFPDRTPEVDRPILGAVAMHWNDEEDTSKLAPKWWDGNGIPNTTTKYKEDQKVSWHATPFEERLDKALSEDKLFPHRKEIRRNLVGFNDEDEENDTKSL
ncbi:uncharacterized protein A4U43_C03F6650 [Asparagus officinalis]|uniref:Protein JASON n=1 Tax=Asparagus officinalis TaxID=4686 RepID=A0A5P1F8M6_ASPOF|nr:protein JASON-like [Asparagus officinalis]ONK74474.1 uncharacterized protein A4U43_C03F6650 [Asparagus officinalis]